MQSIKYIVYLTICKVSKKFYIGVHAITSDHFDNYLGNGIYANKPSSYKKSETPFRRAVNKYGPDQFIRITLFEYDNEEDAYKKEAEIVTEEFIKRKDVYNATIGGNKPPAWSTREIHQYDLAGNYIKTYTQISDVAREFNIRICSVIDAAKEHHNCKGYLYSYDKKNKIEPYKNIKSNKRIAVYNSVGDLIKIYPSIQSCKKDYCGCVHVLYGTRKTCKKCTFKFVD